MSIAEIFLIVWACLMTALWQFKAWEHRAFMRATATVIEDVVNGKAKFVMKENDTGSKTFTIEKVE
jgi:hypothetical protein